MEKAFLQKKKLRKEKSEEGKQERCGRGDKKNCRELGRTRISGGSQKDELRW